MKTGFNFGDCINPGKYFRYSVFTNTTNYVSGQKLISIINPRFTMFPDSIRFPEFINPDFIEITEECIIAGTEYYYKNEGQIYNSELPQMVWNKIRMMKNIELIKQNLYLFHNQSYAFLIDPERLQFFEGSFQKKLTEYVFDANGKIWDGRIMQGIRQIAGTGHGLTPSGDDFIAGLLFGLHLSALIFQKNFLSLRIEIFENACSNNIYSSNFLQFARDGRYYETLRNLVLSLNQENEFSIIENIKSVLSFGETSGSDLLTGFYLCLKNKLYLC